jgi:hypothetical protein
LRDKQRKPQTLKRHDVEALRSRGIVPVKGVKLADPPPAPPQVYAGCAAGVAAKSANAREAADFIRYPTEARNAERWKAAGIEPER